MIASSQINGSVNVFYPVHGRKNILRRISGKVVERGTGPNGSYITVSTDRGYRTLSTKKIVSL